MLSDQLCLIKLDFFFFQSLVDIEERNESEKNNGKERDGKKQKGQLINLEEISEKLILLYFC